MRGWGGGGTGGESGGESTVIDVMPLRFGGGLPREARGGCRTLWTVINCCQFYLSLRNAAFLRHARRHSPHRTAPRTSQSRWNAPPLRAPQCRPWEPCVSVALWPRGTLWLTLWSCGACCGSNGAALCHTPGMWGVWQAGQGGARLECGPQQHPYTAFRDAQQLRRYLVVLVWVARRQPMAAPRVGQRAACRPVVLQATVGFV